MFRGTDVEQAIVNASGLSETEIKTSILRVLFALEFSTPSPASLIALSPNERFLSVVQGDKVHVFWVPGVAFRNEKTAVARFDVTGGDICSLSWSDQPSGNAAPELLICTRSSTSIYSHVGVRLAVSDAAASAASWLRLNDTGPPRVVLGLDDGTALSATVNYNEGTITLDPPGNAAFSASKPAEISALPRELHFLSSPRAGLLLAGWRPTQNPPDDDQAPVILALYEQTTPGVWNCITLRNVCMADEYDASVDLSRQQFTAHMAAPGWDVIAVASNMSTEVDLLGRGLLSGSGKPGKKDSKAWFQWQSLNV